MPSSVSKLEPAVLIVAWPEAGAVQLYQTDLPPALPAWFGSPASLVASTFVPVTLPLVPVIACAAAKLSLFGAVAWAGRATTSPATSATATARPTRSSLSPPPMHHVKAVEDAGHNPSI